jgi:hypothetical protein
VGQACQAQAAPAVLLSNGKGVKMKTYARIVNGHAVDVVTVDPKTIFHPEIAAEFVEVPDGTDHGDTKNGDAWVKYIPPVPPEVVAPKPPVVTPPQFKILILEWLGAIYKAAQDDIVIDTFVKIIDDPRLTEVDLALNSVQTGLKYALQKIGLSDDQIAAAMTKVLSGVLT